MNSILCAKQVQCQEAERLVQEQTLDKFRETLQTQKHTNHSMKERLQQLEDIEQRLLEYVCCTCTSTCMHVWIIKVFYHLIISSFTYDPK